MSKNLLYVGLDVHAQTVTIVLAEADGEVLHAAISIRSTSAGRNQGWGDTRTVDPQLRTTTDDHSRTK